MTHTILYLGSYDRNFRELRGDTTTYVDADGTTKTADVATGKVDGIRFGYMQHGVEFFAVRVEGIVLRAPVLLIPSRHSDDKGFGPRAAYFKDDSAMRLLVDAIVANPEHRDGLGQMIRSLGQD